MILRKWRWELVGWAPYLMGAFIISVGISSILDWLGHLKNFWWLSGLTLLISSPLLVVFLLKVKTSWLRRLILLVLFIVLILIGVGRYWTDAQQMREILNYTGQKVRLTGIVLSAPKVKIKNQLVILTVEKINGRQFNNKKYLGRVVLTTSLITPIEYGDRIEIQGKLVKPRNFNGFDYQKYLAKDKIYLIAYNPKIKILQHHLGFWWREKLVKVKIYFEHTLELLVARPESVLAEGLAFGDRRNFPQWLTDKFRNAGLIHLTALSGLHIMLIFGLLDGMLLWLYCPRKYSFWIISLIILIFVLMTGAHPSAIRAMIMGLIFLFGLKIGRLYSVSRALVLTAGIMILLNPRLLFFDLGFQLSFLATLGAVCLGNSLNQQFSQWGNLFLKKFHSYQLVDLVYHSDFWLRFFNGLGSIMAITLAVQIFTLPWVIFNFHQFPLISLVSNVLIIPLIPLIMILIFLTILAGTIWLPLGKIFGFLALGMGWLVIEIIKVIG